MRQGCRLWEAMGDVADLIRCEGEIKTQTGIVRVDSDDVLVRRCLELACLGRCLDLSGKGPSASGLVNIDIVAGASDACVWWENLSSPNRG